MNQSQQSLNWFIRYKIYHLPLWFIYHYLWWAVSMGSAWIAANSILFSPYSIKYCFYVVFQAVGVYFNFYFLIPKFLEKARYTEYLIYLACTIAITAILIVPGYYVSVFFSGRTFQEMYGTDPSNYMHFLQVNSLPSTVASMTLAMSLKLGKNWIQSKRREQILEKEKLELAKEKVETELKFLRSQFNPHFLFNTINSIFVLINKNPRLASDSLAKFSDILRYQLYECNESQIPLAQELNFLDNFIELQKLRQDQANISLDVNIKIDETRDLMIAPFVLMPFVENAFKHVSRDRQTNSIRLRLILTEQQLHLHLSNTISTEEQGKKELIKPGGIGLKNVRRRLDLLYPQRYTLDIENSEKLFEVSLTLTLSEKASIEIPMLHVLQEN
jgi:hypothetical protein